MYVTKYMYKTSVATNICRNKTLQKNVFVVTKQAFVVTKVCLSRQNDVCHDKHTFVATKDMFRHDKHVHDKHKTFVATKMILVILHKQHILNIHLFT